MHPSPAVVYPVRDTRQCRCQRRRPPVLADGSPLNYVQRAATTKSWRVCALLPHGHDKFWWGVSWGLAEEAKQLNVKLGVYEAGS